MDRYLKKRINIALSFGVALFGFFEGLTFSSILVGILLAYYLWSVWWGEQMLLGVSFHNWREAEWPRLMSSIKPNFKWYAPFLWVDRLGVFLYRNLYILFYGLGASPVGAGIQKFVGYLRS